MEMLRTATAIAAAKLLGRKRPLNVSYFITNKCDLRCDYCNIPETRGHHEQMTTDEIKAMLDEFHSQGMVKFSCSGGEPLLRADLGEVLDHAKSLGAITSITTNGRLVAKRADTLGALHTMLISLDGGQDFQDTTKHNDVKTVINAISLMKRRHGTKVWLSTVLLNHSREQMDFVIAVCRDLDVKVLLQPFHDILAVGKGFDRQLRDEPLKDIFRYALDKAPEVVANSPDYIDMIFNDGFLHPSFCLAGVRTCFINSNGNVFPCLPIMMEDKPTLNGLKAGWREAFESMPTASCATCRYPNQAELYFTFAMKQRTWRHLARMV